MKLRKIICLLIVILGLVCLNTLQAQENKEKIFDSIKIIRVIVRQKYEKANKVSLPFYEYTEKILNYGGISVVKEDAKKYDATFWIEAEGIPEGAEYSIGFR
ncbi:MAG: hypothetical protein QXY96_07080 [Candidatus Methanomethylicaceae archaeon]